MRLNRPPVFGRVEHDEYVLDFRTIRKDEVPLIAQALLSTLAQPASRSYFTQLTASVRPQLPPGRDRRYRGTRPPAARLSAVPEIDS